MPASRHAGRRWYGAAELRRLAAIRFWQRSALIDLGDINDLLGEDSPTCWPEVAGTHIAELRRRAAQLLEAADLLEHIHHHHAGERPDGCLHYEAILDADPGLTVTPG